MLQQTIESPGSPERKIDCDDEGDGRVGATLRHGRPDPELRRAGLCCALGARLVELRQTKRNLFRRRIKRVGPFKKKRDFGTSLRDVRQAPWANTPQIVQKGGFARVHEMKDLTTNTVFAGKIIPKSRITKPHHQEKCFGIIPENAAYFPAPCNESSLPRTTTTLTRDANVEIVEYATVLPCRTRRLRPSAFCLVSRTTAARHPGIKRQFLYVC
ncbi:unnamed protein product [Notodromas monacha]|uniref:Uncharacterized protein n=1 Tax=Notodromas monacha TaxID=399045 RepID=A0A7R9BM60_9CRUS|nr:unnamed protein product [Notodromas monacha]CAG0916694.1 unnamed protein product [Notodromas monacha]